MGGGSGSGSGCRCTTNSILCTQVGEWEKRPGQEELSQAMEGAEAVLESRIKELTDSVTTEEEAKAILGEAARTRAVEPQKVLRSIAFLEKVRAGPLSIRVNLSLLSLLAFLFFFGLPFDPNNPPDPT